MNLNKIVVKKTKVLVTNEVSLNSYTKRREAFNECLVKSLIMGASGNCLKQVSRAGVTDVEFKAISEAQKEFENLVSRLETKLCVVLDNVITDTHTFH